MLKTGNRFSVIAASAALVTAGFGIQSASAADTGGVAASADAGASRTLHRAVLDARTGKVLQFWDVKASVVAPNISIETNAACQASDGKFRPKAPYTQYCFFGAPGTISGNWPYRTGYNTGGYHARACWVGACSATLPAYTEASFGGATVTGTSWTITSVG